MITQISTSLYDHCLSEFDLRETLQREEPQSLQALRRKGMDVFKKLGFPSSRSEEWKYTQLAGFLKEEYAPEPADDLLSIDEKLIEQARIPGLQGPVLVTLNGRYRADLSDTLPASCRALALSAALREPAVAALAGSLVDLKDKPFVALNTALFRDGLFLEWKARSLTEAPIQVIHIRTASQPLLLQPRHLFVLREAAEASVIETYLTLEGSAATLVNEVTEVLLEKNGRLTHYTLQKGTEATRQVQHIETVQAADSVYNHFKASFPGAALLRNNTHVVLDGEHIESHLYGIYLCGGKQVTDNHTLVDHRLPNCQSNELYKGVMKDNATGVFNGKIFVRQDAQKTNAFQQNNNLMLSDQATVDSKPQLEIFADDVKCSHGSTVGQFNEEAIFYLQARGIGLETAKGLLVHAFLFDVTDRIPSEAVREFVNAEIEAALQA